MADLQDLDPKYFPVAAAIIAGLAGIVGIGLGTILGQFGTWIDKRRSDKRILKAALYHQFELFGEMLAFDREFSSQFVLGLRTHLANWGISSAVAEEVFGALPPQLFKSLEVAKADSFKEVAEKHEAIMIRLAEVDPLFASSWSYRSRSRFPDQMKLFLNEATTVSTETNPFTDKFLEHIQDWFAEKSKRKLLSSLESGIIDIAWRISYLTWWNVKRDLKQWRIKNIAEIDTETGEYVAEMVKFAMSNQDLFNKELRNDIEDET